MIRAIVPALVLVLLATAASAAMYRWEEEDGTHFAERLREVPAEHREEAALAAGEPASAADEEDERERARLQAEYDAWSYDVCMERQFQEMLGQVMPVAAVSYAKIRCIAEEKELKKRLSGVR